MTSGRFAALLAHDGVVETCRIGSDVGIMAFHGGSLERGTDAVAVAVAERSGSSLYAVAQPEDLRWHLPSHEVSPEGSPELRRFLDHVQVAIAIHGYGREGFWTRLLLGGSNRSLAAHLRTHLSAALPEFEVVDDMDAIPTDLRGLHRANPVNLPVGGGVQLELPPRIRGNTPHRLSTEPLIDTLAAAVVSYSTSKVPPVRQ